MKNIFVAIEGIDGSGKTELIRGLASYFSASRLKVSLIREPGTSEVGQAIRKVFIDSTTPIKSVPSALLMLASFQHNFDRLQAAFGPGSVDNITFTDRHFLSTLAYQGIDESNGKFFINYANIHLFQDIADRIKLPRPDITFYLDIDPQAAIDRIKIGRASELTRFESVEFLTLARDIYRLYADQYFTVDATESAVMVKDKVIAKLSEQFGI